MSSSEFTPAGSSAYQTQPSPSPSPSPSLSPSPSYQQFIPILIIQHIGPGAIRYNVFKYKLINKIYGVRHLGAIRRANEFVNLNTQCGDGDGDGHGDGVVKAMRIGDVDDTGAINAIGDGGGDGELSAIPPN